MMKLKPLCPGLGLETSDVDLAQPLSDGDFAELQRAFFEGQVLVLLGQSLTPAQFAAFARRLGPPNRTSSISFTTPRIRTS
jgi:taurine dioxygenase